MTDLTLSWAELKSAMAKKGLPASYLQYGETATHYHLALVDGGLVFTGRLSRDGGADTVEFETAYKSQANGRASQTVDPFSSLLFRFNGDSAAGVAAKGQTTDIDYRLTATRRLNGGTMFARDAAWGDYFAYEIVDVDNILGYGPGITLETYVKRWYVDPNSRLSVFLPYGGDIAAGLYIRCRYVSVGTGADVSVFINYNLHRKV